MLIENSKLNIEEFKQILEKLSWNKVPRKLGVDHREFFYIGFLEDDDRIIKAQIRPSGWMQVFETFKNRTLDGKIPPEGFKGTTCDWGSSVEVKVGPTTIEQVKSITQEKPTRNIQVLE